MQTKTLIPKFQLGQTVITANASTIIPPPVAQAALMRHASGDWGDMPDEDKGLNDAALVKDQEGRVMSSYKHGETVFWIITEWDRSVTTVLLPEDY